MIVDAFMLPRTTFGITEASTTRRPSRPSTRRSGSTTEPMAQVDVGWYCVCAFSRACVINSASRSDGGPSKFPVMILRIGAW
jgi:hypothetical protein